MDAASTARLRKAWALVKNGCVTRLGGSRFTVQGSRHALYYVDLSQETPCYCLDAEYRQVECCKHTYAARLAAHDPDLLDLVAEWIQQEETADVHA